MRLASKISFQLLLGAMLLALSTPALAQKWGWPPKPTVEEKVEEPEPEPPPPPPKPKEVELPPAASGEPSPEAKNKSRTYFNAGAQAYEVGDFLTAAQAFEQAYRQYGNPQIAFSWAQALRRQYAIDGVPDRVHVAVALLTRFLSEVQQGKRRVDAATALEALKPVKERLDAAGRGASEEKKKAPTRVLIASPTAGAQISLDGKAAVASPLISAVSPGQHKVTVSAKGYHSQDRELTAVDGTLRAVELVLEPKPSSLRVEGAPGATVYVGAREMGEAPNPVELTAGEHFVAVTMNGHEPYATELSLGRGQERTLSLDLRPTQQRITSFALMGVGVAGVLAAGGLGLAALDRQSDAKALKDAQAVAPLSERQVADYNAAVNARDDFNIAAAVTVAAGGAIVLTGLGLFLFDQSSPPSPDEAASVARSLRLSPAGLSGKF